MRARLKIRHARAGSLVLAPFIVLFAQMATTGTAGAEPSNAPSHEQVTFSKDVAPIFQAKCQECHQPNSIAPMSLITYKEVRPWARSIRERVVTRQMPPWHIDRSVGVQKFKNDMSLTDEQVNTIIRWVDAGAPEGDPKDLPPPKPLVTDNEWKAVRDGYGPPDLVVKSPEFTMAAQHQDVWYRPMSDIPISEPRWVKMVEIRPTNLKGRRILHHSIAYLVLNNDPDAVSKGTGSPGSGVGSRWTSRRTRWRRPRVSPCSRRTRSSRTSSRIFTFAENRCRSRRFYRTEATKS